MADLPNDVDQLQDLLHAAEDLLSDWREARRKLEEAVREYVNWLYDRERFDARQQELDTIAGEYVEAGRRYTYTIDDLERSRQLPEPTHLYRLREIDERLQPFLDWNALTKVGQELELFWQQSVERCLRRAICAVTDVGIIAEQREIVVRQLRDSIAAKRNALRGNESPAVPPIGAKPVDDLTLVPKQRLFGWREILEALGMPNNDENKRRLERKNKLEGGPIPMKRGRGKRPEVDRDELLKWRETWDERLAELEQRDADRTATVAEQSNYGRGGTVVHEIDGHVKKRRGNDS